MFKAVLSCHVTRILLTGCIGLFAALTSPAAQAQQAPIQWRVEDGGNGHWYQWVGTGDCWSARRAAAEAVGAHLATVVDLAELQFIQANSPYFFYLGGYRLDPVPPGDASGGWRWITDEPYNTALQCEGWYPDNERWATGGPVANCVGESNECDAYWFINEWEADCNADGIVDYGQILDGTLIDLDADGVPDSCEADSDGDGVPDESDNCVAVSNPQQTDCDGDGIGDACEAPVTQCPGDYDLDQAITGQDLSLLLAAWGTPNAQVDLTGDGQVDGNDMAVLLAGWGSCAQ